MSTHRFRLFHLPNWLAFKFQAFRNKHVAVLVNRKLQILDGFAQFFQKVGQFTIYLLLRLAVSTQWFKWYISDILDIFLDVSVERLFFALKF